MNCMLSRACSFQMTITEHHIPRDNKLEVPRSKYNTQPKLCNPIQDWLWKYLHCIFWYWSFFLLLCVQIEEEEEETSEMIDPIPKEDTNPPPSLIPVFMTSTQWARQLRLWVSTISCSTNDHQSACQPFGNQFNFHYKALSARFFLQETIVAIKCYHIPKKIMLHITLHICEGGFHLWYPEWNMTAAESSFAYKTVQQETV